MTPASLRQILLQNKKRTAKYQIKAGLLENQISVKSKCFRRAEKMFELNLN